MATFEVFFITKFNKKENKFMIYIQTKLIMSGKYRVGLIKINSASTSLLFYSFYVSTN